MDATIQDGEDESGMVTLAAAQAEFDTEMTYLDAATMGLPPRRSWLARPARAQAMPGLTPAGG